MIGFLVASIVAAGMVFINGQPAMPTIEAVGHGLLTYYYVSTVLVGLFVIFLLLAVGEHIEGYEKLELIGKAVTLQALYVLGGQLLVMGAHDGNPNVLGIASVVLMIAMIVQIVNKAFVRVELKRS